MVNTEIPLRAMLADINEIREQTYYTGGWDWEDTVASIIDLNRAIDLAELKDNQRERLELHYFGGMTVPEVAAKLNVAVTTVQRSNRKALKRVCNVLDMWEAIDRAG